MAVMAVAALTASAQKGEFHVTPHINAGYGNLSNAEIREEVGSFDLTSHLLGGIGADLEYMISNSFGLSVGADYNYLRSTTEKNGHGGELYTDYSFLNVPVLAQYHFGEGFALKAGFQPMFLLEAEAHAKNNNTSKSATKSIKDDFENVTYAIPVGISYTFETPVTVDLRCNIPVTKMNKYEADDSMKMLSVTVSVGYRF